MADPRIKQITIKTGVVKRLAKEKTVYEKEAEREKQRLDKFKAEEKDEHDLRKQEEVINECLMMIPDCQRRLTKAYGELNELLNSEKDLEETQQYLAAKVVMEEAKHQLPHSVA